MNQALGQTARKARATLEPRARGKWSALLQERLRALLPYLALSDGRQRWHFAARATAE